MLVFTALQQVYRTSRAVLDHLTTWSMIMENLTISLDHDRDRFENKKKYELL